MIALITNPYDLIAADFNLARTGFKEKQYLDVVLDQLRPESTILDLGCGTGVPIAAYLTQAGHQVTGVDSSAAMLDLARLQVPQARFVLGDMLFVDFGQCFDAIIAWDSIFHVGRQEHAGLFAKCFRWLKPNGLMLVSLGGSEWEGAAEMYGQPFFYSGYAPNKSLALLEQSGFSIVQWEIDDPSSRGHLAVIARTVT